MDQVGDKMQRHEGVWDINENGFEIKDYKEGSEEINRLEDCLAERGQ